MLAKLQPGTQIIYVPTHAQEDISHPDCEEGFVTRVKNTHAFCRYWSKYRPGELRTKANSEATPLDCLVIRDTVPQEEVDRMIKVINEENIHITHSDISNTGQVLSACGKEPDGVDFFVYIYGDKASEVTCERCLTVTKYLIENKES